MEGSKTARQPLSESTSSSRNADLVRPRTRLRIRSELRDTIKMPSLISSQTNVSTHSQKPLFFPVSKTPLRCSKIPKSERLSPSEEKSLNDYFPKSIRSPETKNVNRLTVLPSIKQNEGIGTTLSGQSSDHFLSSASIKKISLSPSVNNPLNTKVNETAKKGINSKALALERRINNASEPLGLSNEKLEQRWQWKNSDLRFEAVQLTQSEYLSIVKNEPKKDNTVKAYSADTHPGLVRSYNEDRVSIVLNILKPVDSVYGGEWPSCSFFAVYDGHGGSECADFLRDNLHHFIISDANFPQKPVEALKNGFKEAEKRFTEFAESQSELNKSGSCAIVALIIDKSCYIANVGDSRAIMSCRAGKNIIALSRDQKPNDDFERQRIISRGGRIYQNQMSQHMKTGSVLDISGYSRITLGPLRVFPGRLSVSRAFGDVEAKLERYGGKQGVIIADPEVKSYKLTDETDFIFIGCDGVYDKMSNEDIGKCIWNSTRQKCRDLHQLSCSALQNVLKTSMARKTLDNVTGVLIAFEGFKRGAFLIEDAQEENNPTSIIYVSPNSKDQSKFQSSISLKVLAKPTDSNSERNIQDNFDNTLSVNSSPVGVKPLLLPANIIKELQKGELNRPIDDYGAFEFMEKRTVGSQRYKLKTTEKLIG